MKTGDYVKIVTSRYEYYVKIGAITDYGIYGDFTFRKMRSHTFAELTQGGLFPYQEAKSITVIDKLPVKLAKLMSK
jgi:hypothetical protein